MLYHEVAIDPAAIRSLEDLGLIHRMFGYEHGRLIAFMPAKPMNQRDWKTLLYERIKSLDPSKAKRVELQFESLLNRCVWRSRNSSIFEEGATWLELARAEHAKRAFSAILCDAADINQAPVYSYRDLHFPPIDYPNYLREPIHVGETMKDPYIFLEDMRPLISNAKRLVWIDAYFNPLRITRKSPKKNRYRWLESFKYLAAELQKENRTRIDIDIHTKTPADCKPEAFVSEVLDSLAKWIPVATTLKLTAWSEKYGGQTFHARYILTDKGGAGLEYGTDMKMNQRTDVSLLPPALCKQRIEEFDPKSEVPKPYELDWAKTITGQR